MRSLVLFIFGTTLAYTGYLASSSDLTVGLAVAFIGFILIIKPALDARSYYRTHFGSPPRPSAHKSEKKSPAKKSHLKIVNSKDDKPTIH
jgi:hypothetical protein